jgi:hypothetical protein
MVIAHPIGTAIKFIASVVAVDVATKYATNRGKKLHEHVQNKGGYREVFGNTARAASMNVERTVNNVRMSLEDVFYTDGRFDYKKARAKLGETASRAGQAGGDILTGLVKAIEGGAEQFEQRFVYKIFISPEERKTTYKGISGVILRSSFEAVRQFRECARKNLPEDLPYREEIIANIGHEGIQDRASLIEAYRMERYYLCDFGTKEDLMGNYAKVEAIATYL